MRPEPDFPSDLQALEQDYELIRELGRGGMAAVYLARRRDSGKLVTIKAIRARYLDDADALQRFAREARTVADLDHPNIVRTEAIEQMGDRAVAIITEHMTGGTVRDRLREYGAFSAEHAESVLRDVANALGYAHRRGIVHRAVKPENVFLDAETGRALLSDFGIARRIEGDAAITLLGGALGTPQYMSPEQIDGEMVDGRSDIYSLGVLGWELLTGRRPWAGENLYGVIYKQKHEDLPRITSLRPRVPANLLFAIEGALVKDRAKRWQSADEFLRQLTYSPPPVLAQTYPARTAPPDDEPTVKFRRPPPEPPPPLEGAPPAGPGGMPVRGAAHRERASSPGVGPTRRRRARRRPLLRGLALLAPLALAAISLYVVLGGRMWEGSGDDPAGTLTSSSGSIALDTASGSRADPLPTGGAPVIAGASTTAARPAPTPSRPAARRDSAPPAMPSAVPSPRCRLATMADQRACLLAHIAVSDAMLRRVYDSLVVELRRLAGTPRGAPDPPAVTRLRAEQRAWIRARDRGCTRDPAPGSVPFWAGPLSKCFSEMSAARARELEEALRRARQAR